MVGIIEYMTHKDGIKIKAIINHQRSVAIQDQNEEGTTNDVTEQHPMTATHKARKLKGK